MTDRRINHREYQSTNARVYLFTFRFGDLFQVLHLDSQGRIFVRI